MAWVVDTCLLIDIAGADPNFSVASAALLDARRSQGLTLCPVSYVELAPMFAGNQSAQDEFLFHLGVATTEAWAAVDTREAHAAWHQYVADRRTGSTPKRPIADILIGAFASRFDGLLTRNEPDFQRHFLRLPIVTP